MKNKKHSVVLALCLGAVCLLLSGCGDMQSILEIVPGEISWNRENEESGNEIARKQDVSGKTDVQAERDNAEKGPVDRLAEGFRDVLPDKVPEEEAPFLLAEAGDYAYNCLNEDEQLWYRDMEQILGHLATGCRLNSAGLDAGLTEESIDRIFQCVLYDHPELFYVEGYSYTMYRVAGKLTSIEFSGKYTMDKETAVLRKEEIESAAAEILSGVPREATQYDKVKYVYDFIISNTDYDLEVPENQNIYSVFIHHLSVCQGYAKATQYLLNRLGVECTLVLGTVDNGEGHAWNLAKIDGNYYYLDTTWGDASYRMSGEETQADMPVVNYDYLNITTEELLRTHSIGGEIPMPECVSREANYYVRNEALFRAYDREQMAKLFEGLGRDGKGAVTIKCEDAVCYEEIRSALVDSQEIFKFLKETDKSVTFSQNDTQLSMTFWVTNE